MASRKKRGERVAPEGGQPRGRDFNAPQVMRVFVAWIQNGRRARETAEATGVRESTIHKYVSRGKPSQGIPAFPELAEQCEATWMFLLPNIQDVILDAYKWNRRRSIAQTLVICEHLRKKVLDAAAGEDLSIKSPEDAVKVADAVRKLEREVMTDAVAMLLVEGEEPRPKQAAPEKPADDKPDVREMSEDELRARAGADVVPLKKDGAA